MSTVAWPKVTKGSRSYKPLLSRGALCICPLAMAAAARLRHRPRVWRHPLRPRRHCVTPPGHRRPWCCGDTCWAGRSITAAPLPAGAPRGAVAGSGRRVPAAPRAPCLPGPGPGHAGFYRRPATGTCAVWGRASLPGCHQEGGDSASLLRQGRSPPQGAWAAVVMGVRKTGSGESYTFYAGVLKSVSSSFLFFMSLRNKTGRQRIVMRRLWSRWIWVFFTLPVCLQGRSLAFCLCLCLVHPWDVENNVAHQSYPQGSLCFHSLVSEVI